MSDFLNYWDTRIIRHKMVFDAHPQIANFAYCECEKIWDYMEGESKALLTRHNALVEAVHKAMGRTADCDKKQTDSQLVADVAYLKRIASDYFKSSAEWRCRAFAAEQELNALVEAVAWERETYVFWEFGRTYTLVANDEALESMFAARAEVDRLIAESKWVKLRCKHKEEV